MITLAVLAAIVTNTAGPAFTLHGWLAVLILAGLFSAALVSMAALYRKVIRPTVQSFIRFSRGLSRMIKGVDHLVEIKEPLLELVQDFKPNSGGSLHDKIVRIDSGIDSALAGVEALKTGQEVLSEGHNRTADRLHELWAYSHESKHDIVNALTQVAPSVKLIEKMAEKLAATPQEMDPV